MDDDQRRPMIVDMSYGNLNVHVESPATWTPEVIEHVLTRVRRELVASARQLGVTLDPAEQDAE